MIALIVTHENANTRLCLFAYGTTKGTKYQPHIKPRNAGSNARGGGSGGVGRGGWVWSLCFPPKIRTSGWQRASHRSAPHSNGRNNWQPWRADLALPGLAYIHHAALHVLITDYRRGIARRTKRQPAARPNQPSRAAAVQSGAERMAGRGRVPWELRGLNPTPAAFSTTPSARHYEPWSPPPPLLKHNEYGQRGLQLQFVRRC